MEQTVNCCVVACEKPLNKQYWDTQYQTNTIGWDLGEVSPPLQSFIDAIADKNQSILIPGCGNSYEAAYLLEKGFTNITLIDIAPTLVADLQKKFSGNNHIQIVSGDFFYHKGNYDIILEQTFFCALPPVMRQRYVVKMHQLLNTDGMLAGLLFNRSFEKGPPFGGSKIEYEKLFETAFHIEQMETCANSVAPRANTELWFQLRKNNDAMVHLYQLQGISCSGCLETTTKKLESIPKVNQVSFSTDMQQILLVSSAEIPIEILQQAIADEPNYTLSKIA